MIEAAAWTTSGTVGLSTFYEETIPVRLLILARRESTCEESPSRGVHLATRASQCSRCQGVEGSVSGINRDIPFRINAHSTARLYTRAAVPKNMSSRSLAEYGAAIFFSAFHNTRYDSEKRSTGKFDSNMHRLGVKHSIACS